jgi:cytochrome c oxidase subunit III
MFAMTLNAEDVVKQRNAKRMLLWFGIISIVMLFAGLTSAYIVREGDGKWVQFSMPALFKLSTALIVVSSISMQWAITSVRKDNMGIFIVALGITILLGIGFVISQYFSWSQLVDEGIYFSGRISDIKTHYNYVPTAKNETAAMAGDASNVAGSFLFAITGLHVLHLLGGMIAIFFVFSQALKKNYSSANYNGVRMCVIYWHFLDGLWIYLYVFLLYIR